MTPFWLNRELMEKESTLLALCLEAHAKSAFRQNISSMVLRECARGSQDYVKALIGALSTIGGTHAPLMDTWLVISGIVNVPDLLQKGQRVPGWGSSFAEEDEIIWKGVADHLQKHYPDIWKPVAEVTELLKASGKNLAPNPSALTAAAGIALRVPPPIMPWIFIQGRLEAWTYLFMQTTLKSERP